MILETAVPLIVCGRQRAGTRYIADILQLFEEVNLQGEIPSSVLNSMMKFMDNTEQAYEKLGQRDERWHGYYNNWKSKKKELMFSLWYGVSCSKAKKSPKICKYFGYKRPSEEFYYDFYEKHLGKDEVNYVYCIRNFKENYLSVKSRWPKKEISQISDDYVASINQYIKMKEKSPNKIVLFNLDDRIKYGFEYVEQSILNPLGLVPDDMLRQKLAGMGARNQTVEVAKVPRRRELTPSEARYIGKRPELANLFEKLCV